MASGNSVTVELLAKTGSFDTDIQRSTKAAEKRLKDFEKQATAIGKTVGVAFIAAGAALVAFAKQTIDGIDALNDVADATGASIENISALEDVALRTGASLDDVSSLLNRVNKVLKDASGIDGASQAIKALGLNIADLRKLDPAEATLAIAKAMSQFADDANKARIGQELLGKEYAKQAPLLKDIAEKGELNAKVTKQQAEEAEAFNKQLFALQKNFTDISRDLVGPVVKSINEVTEAFKRGREAGQGYFSIGWDRYVKNVKEFYGIQEKMQGATGGWGEPESGNTPTSPSLPSLPTIDPEAQRKSDEARKQAEADRKKADASFKAYLDGLKRQLEATEDLTQAEKVLRDIQEGRVLGVTKAGEAQLLVYAQELDAKKEIERVDKEREASQKRINESQKQFSDYINQLKSDTASPFERYLSGLEELQARYELGVIDAELYSKATKKLGDDFVAAGEKAKEEADAMSEFAKRAQENIQDALGNTLEDALAGNFDNIGKMWLQLIQKMVAQAAAAQLNEQLFGKNGSGQNWMDALFQAGSSYFSGSTGSTSSLQGPTTPQYPLATGTNYVPYDNFPAILHEGEAVVPKEYNPAAGGKQAGTSFVFGPTYVGSNVSLPEVDALVTAKNMQLKAEIIRSQRQTA
jgi:hypothetical protein